MKSDNKSDNNSTEENKDKEIECKVNIKTTPNRIKVKKVVCYIILILCIFIFVLGFLYFGFAGINGIYNPNPFIIIMISSVPLTFHCAITGPLLLEEEMWGWCVSKDTTDSTESPEQIDTLT